MVFVAYGNAEFDNGLGRQPGWDRYRRDRQRYRPQSATPATPYRSLAIAPNAPSRLDVIFAWPTIELAQEFRKQYLPEGAINVCRVAEGSAFELDGGLLPPGINLEIRSAAGLENELESTRRRAEIYWRRSQRPELR
jgi:hypothetical protein